MLQSTLKCWKQHIIFFKKKKHRVFTDNQVYSSVNSMVKPLGCIKRMSDLAVLFRDSNLNSYQVKVCAYMCVLKKRATGNKVIMVCILTACLLSKGVQITMFIWH